MEDLRRASHQNLAHTYRWIPIALGTYAVLGALVSFIGWVINVQRLTDLFNLGISIQPNTALAAILAGLSVLLLAFGARTAAFAAGLAAGFIGAATLFQYMVGVNIGIDSLFMFGRDWGAAATSSPGRMGPPAAVSFTLVGLIVLLDRLRGSVSELAPTTGIVIAAISVTSLAGYLFGANNLYMLPALTAISLQTATFLTAIGFGFAFAMPDREPVKTLYLPSGAGVLFRRTLPFIVVGPIILGLLRQLGQRIGLYDTSFGTALRTVVEVILFTVLLWFAVRTVRNREVQTEEAAAARARSESDLTDFFENATVGLHFVGPDGTILRVNKAELDLLGYTAEEYVGRSIVDFHVDRAAIDDILRRLTNGERLQDYSARMRCKDGQILDVLISSSALFRNGEFIHTRCFTRDVTEQRRTEQALLEADRRKDEFLATLAHELRNPLAPISNSLELMKRADGDSIMMTEAHSVAERQVAHMVRLIDDLLDLSRITRNKLELRQERTDLVSAVKDAVETCRPIAESEGLELKLEVPDRPIYIDADPVRIAQVVGNLVTNACKFNRPGGSVSVAVSRNDTDATIVVSDTGIGIPAEMLDRVFEMFTQVDRSAERTKGGLGIGLSLSKRLVEMHSGAIEVRSRGDGVGTDFIVRLPVAIGETADGGSVDDAPAAVSTRRRILVVDDNLDSAQSLALLLKLVGNDTEIANDGYEAIEKFRSFRPDTMLLDIGMPGMSGYEVCRAVRAESAGKDLLIIAMTGWGQESDRQQSREAGFDHHLVKPVDHAELQNLLAGQVDVKTVHEDGPTRSRL